MVDLKTYIAGAICDALGERARPGAVAAAEGRIVAAGELAQVAAACGGELGRVVSLPNVLLLPRFVNAHAHLGLTSMGPRPYGGSFTDWLRMAMREAPTSEDEIRGGVVRGAEISRRGGVGWVGDIAGSTAALLGRCGSGGVAGVGYLECFGVGSRGQSVAGELGARLEGIELEMARIQEREAAGARVLLGVQPHAPYSAGLELYVEAARLAQRRGYRLSTHLAETEEEIRFVREGAGPFVDLLRELGKWDGSIRATGLHPVQWLEPALRMGPWLLAHCNYVEDAHIEVLARCGASVAYCPVASEYFGHHQPWRGSVHRYRQMLEAGVNVCLGTDSILCQPADATGGASLGVLEQMRHLYRRDGTDPQVLLRMATVNGMRAMGLPEVEATLRGGAAAKLVGIAIDPDDPMDPLEQVLRNNAGVSVIEK